MTGKAARQLKKLALRGQPPQPAITTIILHMTAKLHVCQRLSCALVSYVTVNLWSSSRNICRNLVHGLGPSLSTFLIIMVIWPRLAASGRLGGSTAGIWTPRRTSNASTCANPSRSPRMICFRSASSAPSMLLSCIPLYSALGFTSVGAFDT